MKFSGGGAGEVAAGGAGESAGCGAAGGGAGAAAAAGTMGVDESEPPVARTELVTCGAPTGTIGVLEDESSPDDDPPESAALDLDGGACPSGITIGVDDV